MPDTKYLVEILLPLYDNDGNAVGEQAFAPTRQELTEKFGGLTAHVRAPARGLWKTDEGRVERDDIAILEVMADALDREWWAHYRHALEARFRQLVIVIRAIAIATL